MDVGFDDARISMACAAPADVAHVDVVGELNRKIHVHYTSFLIMLQKKIQVTMIKKPLMYVMFLD